MTEIYHPEPLRERVIVRFDDGATHALTRDGYVEAPATLFPCDLVWSPETNRNLDAELEAAEAAWDTEHAGEVEEAERVARDSGFDDGKAEGYADARLLVAELAGRLVDIEEITALVNPGVVEALADELVARVEAALAPPADGQTPETPAGAA